MAKILNRNEPNHARLRDGFLSKRVLTGEEVGRLALICDALALTASRPVIEDASCESY